MTVLIKRKESEDKRTQVELEWDKSNVYYVEVTQKNTKDSPLAYVIRKSRCYSTLEIDKAKATFNRYCKRYL